jgi:hypothetical protein
MIRVPAAAVSRLASAALAVSAVVALPPCGGAAEPFAVKPAAAPTPAMKYQLLPEVRELHAGNAAQWYVRAFAEQRNFFFNKEPVAARRAALVVPLDKFPKQELAYYGGNALKQVDYGARHDAIGWEVIDRVRAEGLDAAHPEMASYGVLGEALHVRFRLELAEKRFDAAVVTAKTMLAFARHLAEHPTLAGTATALEVANRALDGLDEFVRQPGSPNLYWALTDLPTPLVEVKKGLQGQVAAALNDIGVPDDAALTEAQVEKLVSRLSGVVGFAREQTGDAPRNFRAELRKRLNDADHMKAVRKRLHAPGAPGDPARGLAALPVAAFTPAHAVLLDEKRDFERRRDELMKLLRLPAWQIDALPVEKSGGVFDSFLPPVVETRKAQAKLDQRVAVLRLVEAVRMHAAENGGKLPQTLADVRLPLPLDPLTGKAFGYEVKAGATVVIK